MKTTTRYAVRAAAEEQVIDVFDTSEIERALMEEILSEARLPLDLELTPDEQAAAIVAAAELDPALAAVVDAIRARGPQPEPEQRAPEYAELLASALEVLGKFAVKPEPDLHVRTPDVHIHTPRHDLHVDVTSPEFKPEINVEGMTVEVPEREVKVDVQLPAQEAPVVNVQPAEPQVVVQAAAPPTVTIAPAEVSVTVPDTIRTIPAETETVAERDSDDLIVRSVTRPTGG